MDISSRHLPDLSDVSAAQESDASFQIPLTSKSPSKLLFAEDGLDFLADDTLNSPAQQQSHPTSSTEPLSVATPTPDIARTPRSRRRRRTEMSSATPLRRSPRKRPAIPSPLKECVASDMSTALEDTLSPFKRQPEYSFQIPTIGKQTMDLLMEDDGMSFLGKGVNATFDESSATPRAHEPLTLSQLSPGPKPTRSVGSPPTEHAMSPSQDAHDDENTTSPATHPGHQPHIGAPVPYSSQPTSFSNLMAEVETLMDDQEEPAQGPARSSPSPLASYAPVIGQPTESIEDNTKHAPDAVEKESPPPHAQISEIAYPEPDGVATEPVPEPGHAHGSDARLKDIRPSVIGGLTKPSKLKPPSAGHARTTNSSEQKPISQPRPPACTTSQPDRDRKKTPERRANSLVPVSREAGTGASYDTTLSDAEGLAAALLSFGQRPAAVPVRLSAKASNSKSRTKLDRTASNVNVASSVPMHSDLVREAVEPEGDAETQMDKMENDVVASGADTLSQGEPNHGNSVPHLPSDEDGPLSAPSHVAVLSPSIEDVPMHQPEDDLDVAMDDVQSQPDDIKLSASTASPEIQTAASQQEVDQTNHDVSKQTLVEEAIAMDVTTSPTPAMGSSFPKRTSAKRRASDIEESDDPGQQQPSPEPVKPPRRKKAKLASAPAPAPRARAQKARTASGTKRGTAAARGVRNAPRTRSSRAKPAAAQPSGVSALESGVVPSSSSLSTSSATATAGAGTDHVRALNRSQQQAASEPGSANADAIHESIARDGSTPTAGGHMTRARTRILSGNSSAGASSSVGFALGASSSGSSSRSGGEPGLARSNSSIADNPCDERNPVGSGGRQVPSYGEEQTETNAKKHGHMDRSGLTQSSVWIPPAKPTVPQAFHFESEARLEARRSGERAADENTLKRSHQYKAQHEAQARELAARREHIMPVQSREFHFSTDSRVQEREKWDEARRAREREAERLLEEKRRLETLREEEEIRELRRRAVPKAHELPEWYQHAPKRSQDARK